MLVRTHRKGFGYGFTRYGFFILVILAIIGITVPAMACDGGWYNSGWGHRKSITIDKSKVVTDQKDFPVMINLGSDPDLVGHAQTTGNDLVFTLSDGTTKLPCKVESYSSGNGALVAWVKVPLLSSTENTRIYLYYGNHGSASNQQDTSGNTWTDTYKGNWRKRDIVSWVQTEFNNHNSPSTFYSMGSDEAQPVAVTPTPTLTPTPTVTPTPMPTPPADAPMQTQQWSDCGWSYRRAITIDHTKVTADQADFPVLITLTSDAGLAAHAQPSGNDILFTLGDEKTKVPHRIESYTSTTGALVAWVRVPSLSSSVNTVLYMYYGDPNSPAQQDSSGTWSYRFKGTWNRNAIKSWVMTKYNNQMNPSTFFTLGPETFPPQSCSTTPAPSATLTQVAMNSVVTQGSVDPALTMTTTDTAVTLTQIDPTETPTPADPTAAPTTAEPIQVPTTVEPTPVPTPAFSCAAGTSGLVTGDGELAGCVALTNDWVVNETTDEFGNSTYNGVINVVSVTYTIADGYCLGDAKVALTYDTTPVEPQYSQVFDLSACTRDYTFDIEMPINTEDVAYIYLTPTGTVQKTDATGAITSQDVTSPDSPIFYVILG